MIQRRTTTSEQAIRAPSLHCDGQTILRALWPMVGRDDDLAEACRRTLGATERLITITGPVGVGKSRLTIAMAAALAEEDGLSVYVMDLATVVDRAGLTAAVVDVLGIPSPAPPTLAGLGAALPDTDLLLVLDRCDQLRAEVAELATAVLAGSARARVVVTSREPLHIYGEQLLAVRPLPVPDVSTDQTVPELLELPSVALFIQRLANVRPFFRLTDGNRRIVAQLCAQLDGLPLAIEQAAAQLKVLQPQTLLNRLQESIEALGGPVNASPVHSPSLPDALTEHVAGLPAEARALLASLAIVNREFRLQDVEAVADVPAGHAQHLLEMLVDRNLVEVCEDAGDDLRLRMLHTTRTFVRGLPAADDREEALRRYVDRLVAEVTTRSGGRLEPLAGQVVSTAEHEDLSTAFAYLRRTGRAEDALRYAAALVPHFVARGDCTQGLTWIEAALTMGTASADDAVATALRGAGRLASLAGDHDLAARYHEQALALARTTGPASVVADALRELALTAHRAGNLSTASELLHEADRMCAPPEGGAGAPATLVGVAAVRLDLDDPGAAAALAREALRMFEAARDQHGGAAAHAVLADVAVRTGDPAAEQHCLEVLRRVRQHDPLGLTADCIEGLATVVSTAGGPGQRRAVRLLAAAAAHRERTGLPAPVARAATVRRSRELLRAALGPEQFAADWAAGQRSVPAAPFPSDDREPTGAMLTARQREVAELVGQGLTNREIARRLGVAEWTAVNHVRHLLRKLQFTSRVQVARWVARQSGAGHPQPPAESRS